VCPHHQVELTVAHVRCDGESQRRRDAPAPFGLPQRRSVTLEDLLPVVGHSQPTQQRRNRAQVGGSRRAEQPGLLPQLPRGRRYTGQRMVRADDKHQPVVHHRPAGDGVVDDKRPWPDSDVHGPGQQQ